MQDLFQDKQLLISVILVILGIAVRLALRYLVTIRPELKRYELIRKWEFVIALVNQYRKNYLRKFPKDQSVPYQNIKEALKEFAKIYGVSVEDVTAHRRKIKDSNLAWMSLDGGADPPATSYNINAVMEKPPEDPLAPPAAEPAAGAAPDPQ
jgi:hypothetical protein